MVPAAPPSPPIVVVPAAVPSAAPATVPSQPRVPPWKIELQALSDVELEERRAALHDAIVQLEAVRCDRKAADLLRAGWQSDPRNKGRLDRFDVDLLSRDVSLPEQRLEHLGIKEMHVMHEIEDRSSASS